MALKQLYLLDVNDVLREGFFSKTANANAAIGGLNKSGATVLLSTKIGGLNNRTFEDSKTLVYNQALDRFETRDVGSGGAAGGHLQGDYPNPTIANKVVQPELHFKASGYGPLQVARVNQAGNAWEVVTKSIVSMAEPIAGEQGRIVRVNGDHNGFETVPPELAGARSLQYMVSKWTNPDSTTNSIPISSAPPLKTQGKEYAYATITPRSASSLIHIKFHCFLCSEDTFRATLALFQGTGVNAVYAVCTEIVQTNNEPAALLLEAWLPSPGLAEETYHINFGGSGSGTTYINRTSSLPGIWGAARASYLLIEEVIGTLN